MRDRHAVVWTREGGTPVRMGRVVLTDTHSRFTYDEDYLERVAAGEATAGLGFLYDPALVGAHTIAWRRTPHFDFHPQLQALIPPRSSDNFQRRLVLAWLEHEGLLPGDEDDDPAARDWAILVHAGHGAIGHLDVFEDDAAAREWYAAGARRDREMRLQPIGQALGHSLREMTLWGGADASEVVEALGDLRLAGPTPSVGGAIAKILVSIPAGGWDGRIAPPVRDAEAAKNRGEPRIDVLLKFEQPAYPGIRDLEALALDLHREAGFEVPRYWKAWIEDVPVLAIERVDREPDGRPRMMETLYALMATGSSRITDNSSGTYDDLLRAIDRSPIPFVSDPAESREHLMRRLLLALASGNGDLHMENLAILRMAGWQGFSPVYDPTPMRAYSRHNLLAPMGFGGYGEGNDLESAIRQLAREAGMSDRRLAQAVEEVLEVTRELPQRLEAIERLPGPFRERLVRETGEVRRRLARLLRGGCGQF